MAVATFLEGDAYASMGSSSWITVSASEPLLDDRVRPFVFAHVAPGMFISATSIFSSGTSFNWVTDTLLPDVKHAAEVAGMDVHDALFRLAAEAPAGARGLIFVPTLGGGTSFEADRQCAAASSGWTAARPCRHPARERSRVWHSGCGSHWTSCAA